MISNKLTAVREALESTTLSKAADTLGMRNYRLTVTPKDFMMLQDHAARVTDSAVVMVSARNVSNLPIEVKW